MPWCADDAELRSVGTLTGSAARRAAGADTDNAAEDDESRGRLPGLGGGGRAMEVRFLFAQLLFLPTYLTRRCSITAL